MCSPTWELRGRITGQPGPKPRRKWLRGCSPMAQVKEGSKREGRQQQRRNGVPWAWGDRPEFRTGPRSRVRTEKNRDSEEPRGGSLLSLIEEGRAWRT